MNSELGRWKGKNQPALTRIDGREAQDIAKEGAIGFRIPAVEEDVGTDNYAREFSRFGLRSSRVWYRSVGDDLPLSADSLDDHQVIAF